MPKVWKDGAWIEADPEYAPNVYIGSIAPSSPLIGTFWFDTSVNSLKIWNGTVWGITIPTPFIPPGGGGNDKIFYENGQTVTSNYTISAGKNAVSSGPITINSGVTVTIPTGSSWSIV